MDKLELLKSVFGHDSFREAQESVIDALLAGRDVLAVMPTGSGKSICYQIPALMREGIALVISPLISLMSDQVMALKNAGIRAAYLNSSLTPTQQREAIRRAGQYTYKLIYVAPERLMMPQFLEFARSCTISMIAVDEAHCVSQWGQDFRPSYTRIAEFARMLPSRPPVAAFTATATRQVRQDMKELLDLRDPFCVTTGYDRPNLHFSVVQPSNRVEALLVFLNTCRGESGIVYCSSRKRVEETARSLRAAGYAAAPYHAGMEQEDRARNQEDFQFDRVKIMVATNAFGMGIDKPNVRFVVHMNMPLNLENYYQEAGRAGRDGKSSQCILFFCREDIRAGKWLIENSKLEADIPFLLCEKLIQRDLKRFDQMIAYATSSICLRRFLLEYFGEEAPKTWCDNCSVCDGSPFAVDTGMLRSVMRDPSDDSYHDELQIRKRAARKEEKREAAFGGYERALYENLLTLRSLLAAMQGKCLSRSIFGDETLRQMALTRPMTHEALRQIRGVNDYKLDMFGNCFLEVIRNGAEPNEAALLYNPAPVQKRSIPLPEPPSLPPLSTPENCSALSWARVGDKWCEAEDAALKMEFQLGTRLEDIAKLHKRKEGAVRSRLRKLRLIQE